MTKKRRRAFVVIGVSAASLGGVVSCFDTSGFGGGGIDAGSTDASFADSTAEDASASDTGADSSLPFTCDGVDATFCDDFDRDAAVEPGAPWAVVSAGNAACTVIVDGTYESAFDASTGSQHCYLQTNATPNVGHFTMDFDVSYDTDTTNAQTTIIAAVALTLTSMRGGLASEIFQLQLTGTGSGRATTTDYYPDAASSPDPGFSYVGFTNASAQPWVHPSPPCHVTWTVDTTAPSSIATATCGKAQVTMTPYTGAQAAEAGAGSAVVQLGFQNPGGSLPAWAITYDNFVFRSSP